MGDYAGNRGIDYGIVDKTNSISLNGLSFDTRSIDCILNQKMFDSEDKIESIETEERDSQTPPYNNVVKQFKKPVVKEKRKKKSKKFHPSLTQVDPKALGLTSSFSINSYQNHY